MRHPYDISIYLLKVTNYSIEFAFSSIQDFFLELNKKITIDSDFIRSTEYPRIIKDKSRKY